MSDVIQNMSPYRGRTMKKFYGPFLSGIVLLHIFPEYSYANRPPISIDDKSWDKQYQCPEFGSQYTVQIKSAEPEKARVAIEAMLRQHGGKPRSDRGYPYAMYVLPAQSAKKASLETIRFGTLTEYRLNDYAKAGTVEEIDGKIESLSAELSQNHETIEKMPIANTLLSNHLARLKESRKACEVSVQKSSIQITVIAEGPSESQ